METPPSKKRGFLYWLKLLAVGLVGGIVMFYTGYIVLWVKAETRPASMSPCCIIPSDLGFDYEDVSFTTADGVALSGWYIPSQNGAAVIMLHGDGANRAQMLPRAELLARHGYGVLLYDLRAHGKSAGDVRALGWLDADDVPAALVFLQSRDDVDPERIGILGFSLGGQIALRAAAAMDDIKAVVGEEPGFVTLRDVPP
jgi:dipeptidyl aminopeptidase/acylaminoacyl peptidase